MSSYKQCENLSPLKKLLCNKKIDKNNFTHENNERKRNKRKEIQEVEKKEREVLISKKKKKKLKSNETLAARLHIKAKE